MKLFSLKRFWFPLLFNRSKQTTVTQSPTTRLPLEKTLMEIRDLLVSIQEKNERCTQAAYAFVEQTNFTHGLSTAPAERRRSSAKTVDPTLALMAKEKQDLQKILSELPKCIVQQKQTTGNAHIDLQLCTTRRITLTVVLQALLAINKNRDRIIQRLATA